MRNQVAEEEELGWGCGWKVGNENREVGSGGMGLCTDRLWGLRESQR